MPLTVITLKKVPPSLRGDLSQWMQEIATGVYVGNFNSRVREELWKRVAGAVGEGEATLSYACRNEIGYNFSVINTDRQVVDCDGIPLVLLPQTQGGAPSSAQKELKEGFSKAAHFHKARQFSGSGHGKGIRSNSVPPFVVIDVETNGLDPYRNQIIEIGAVKRAESSLEKFDCLIKIENALPESIIELTNITDELLRQKGVSLPEAMDGFLQFIGKLPLVGYNVHFDLDFLNASLGKSGFSAIQNPVYDVMAFVKQENMFLTNYKLETVLQHYGIAEKVPHRACEDAELTYRLSLKVKKFLNRISKNR